MSKESRFENRQMDEAYVDYERALHQAKVVCDKIDEDEPNRAASSASQGFSGHEPPDRGVPSDAEPRLPPQTFFARTR